MSTNKDEIKKAIEHRFVLIKFPIDKDYPIQYYEKSQKRKLKSYGEVYQSKPSDDDKNKENGSQAKYKA